MHIFLIFVFSLSLAYANNKENCYSIQLKSFVIKKDINYKFEDYHYPQECQLIKFTKMNAVRCGCYKNYSEAKKLKTKLIEKYQDSTIVTTYSYRFNKKLVSRNKVKQSSHIEVNDEELRLIFQVFTYSSDLENAYKTAEKAVRIYPNSIYWHQKLAEVSQWTGKSEEAMQNYEYVYKHRPSEKLQDKIYKYALSFYQYDEAAKIIKDKVQKDSSDKNIEELLYIYNLVGKPLESADILNNIYYKDKSRTNLLSKQLQIYLNVGELDLASNVVKEIEKEGLNDIVSARLLSRYYFLKRDTKKSYMVLKQVDKKSIDANSTKYYMQVSDLAWYLQKFGEAAQASVKVNEQNQTRLVDYERIFAVYKTTDKNLASKAALDGYKKFHKNYLFYNYADIKLQNREYKELLNTYAELEKDKNLSLKKEILFWMLKAQGHTALNENDKAILDFKVAQGIDPTSPVVSEAILWFLIDTKEDLLLEKFLFKLEENKNIDSILWTPMSVAYFNLQKSDKSLYYINKLQDKNLNNTSTDFIYAYIKISQNEEGAFYKQMRQIYTNLQAQLDNNPSLYKNKTFLQNYLTAKMFFVNPDLFKKELKDSEKTLDARAYNELNTAWVFRESVDEQIKYTAQKFRYVEPWLVLNIGLNDYDKTTIQDILYRYYKLLPTRDRVQSARTDYQIFFAQSLAFTGLEDNEKDELLYDQMRQLHNEYADYFLMKNGYLDRTGLNQVYTDMHNSYYLAKGYSLETDLFLASNSISDNTIFENIPSNTKEFGFGIKKRFNRGFWQVDAGIKDSVDTYNYFSFKYNTILTRHLNLEVSVDIGAEAQESVYTLVGGYKDRVSVQSRYQLLGSSSIGVNLEKANYYSQDGEDIGDGITGRIDFSYLQRSAYPDLQITPYYSFGIFDEKSGSKGVIDNLTVFDDTKILSDDFWYFGVDLSYGMENRYNYVRVWRPFFSVSPYYNGRLEEFNIGSSVGFGGELFGQDNLSFVFDYSQSVAGTDDEVLRTFLRYKILY